MQIAVLISVLIITIAAQNSTPLGVTLIRSAGVDAQLPINYSAAVASGWVSYTNCDPNLGIAVAHAGTPSVHNPLTLYFTATGAIAGIGYDVFGDQQSNLIQKGYWNLISSSNKQYRASVSFRPSTEMCSSTRSQFLIGDRLILNADTIGMRLPITVPDAITNGWTKGSCIQGMGTHWSYDVATHPKMSWQDANLLPVVTMYIEEKISAIFFNTPVTQQSIFPPNSNDWDLVPIPTFLMCQNWCDSTCTWGTSFWSTGHVFFYNPSVLTCGCSSQVCCN